MSADEAITPRVVVIPTPSQVVRLEPVVAHVHGGGTSAVVIRGDEYMSSGGIRVTRENGHTATAPLTQPAASTGLAFG